MIFSADELGVEKPNIASIVNNLEIDLLKAN